MLRLYFITFVGSALAVFAIMPNRQMKGVCLVPSVAHLGIINPNEVQFAESKFTLVNNSASDVALVNLVTACVCSSVDADERTLSPGDSAVITVRIRTAGMRGIRLIPVQIYTDHLEYPHFELTTICDFTTSGKISPFHINLPTSIVSSEIDWECDLPVSEAVLESLQSVNLPEWLSIQFVNTENRTPFVRFIGKAPEQEGIFNFSFLCKFDGAEVSTTATAYLQVTPRFEYAKSLNLGLVERNENQIVNFRITDRMGLPFTVGFLSVDAAKAESEVAITKRGVADVKLKFTPKGHEGPSTSEMTCEIKPIDSLTPIKIKIPIQYRVLP